MVSFDVLDISYNTSQITPNITVLVVLELSIKSTLLIISFLEMKIMHYLKVEPTFTRN